MRGGGGERPQGGQPRQPGDLDVRLPDRRGVRRRICSAAPEFERKITVGKTVFYRIVRPTTAPTTRAARTSGPRGADYHVILIAGAARGQPDRAAGPRRPFGMKVYPALPLAPRDRRRRPGRRAEGTATLTTLTRRIMQDYGARFQTGPRSAASTSRSSCRCATCSTSGTTRKRRRRTTRRSRSTPRSTRSWSRRCPAGRSWSAPTSTRASGFRSAPLPSRSPGASRPWPEPGSGSSRRRTAGAPARSGSTGRTSARRRWTSGCARSWGRRPRHRVLRLDPRLLPGDGRGADEDGRAGLRRAALGQRGGLRAVRRGFRECEDRAAGRAPTRSGSTRP